jgi:hypothetical protein
MPLQDTVKIEGELVDYRVAAGVVIVVSALLNRRVNR